MFFFKVRSILAEKPKKDTIHSNGGDVDSPTWRVCVEIDGRNMATPTHFSEQGYHFPDHTPLDCRYGIENYMVPGLWGYLATPVRKSNQAWAHGCDTLPVSRTRRVYRLVRSEIDRESDREGGKEREPLPCMPFKQTTRAILYVRRFQQLVYLHTVHRLARPGSSLRYPNRPPALMSL